MYGYSSFNAVVAFREFTALAENMYNKSNFPITNNVIGGGCVKTWVNGRDIDKEPNFADMSNVACGDGDGGGVMVWSY